MKALRTKRIAAAAAAALLAWVLLSCATPPAAAPGGGQPAAEPSGQLAQRMREYLENGMEKLDQGAISEGIAQLVAVLAEHSAAPQKDQAAEELRRRAETELTKVKAGLALEAGTEWLDANKNQLTASSVSIGGENSRNPSVLLTLNYGGAGKALVTGAPIRFEFIKGAGMLTASANTNDYGQANCSLASLEDPAAESIIRASLTYQTRGFTYAFEGVSKDFVYAPPARRATIVVLERAGADIIEDPVVLHAVYDRIKALSFEFSHYNGRLLGDDFLKVFGGDPQAIRRMGLEKEVSYLVMVLNDAHQASQVELQGKKYNIWKAQASCTAHLIRVSDGKIMYSATAQAVAGQGGTAPKALLDGLRNAAAAIQDQLDRDLPEIERVLSGRP